MVGDGRYKNQLIKLIQQEKVENYFNFIDRKSPQDIPKLLSLCDIGLIVLNKSPLFSKTIPAKTQSYLASGIPILASADGEVYNLVNNHKLGIAAKAGDEQSLFEALKKFSSLDKQILNEFKNNALNYSLVNFSKEKLLNQIELWFEELL